jgi:hypothetical protein
MPHTNKQLAQGRLKENDLARSCIHSKYLKLEPELQETKWFGYRFMSPYQATQKFAFAYEKHYKHAFARHFDRYAKPRPINWAKFAEPGPLMTQLWGARQNADRLGMPYDDYLEFFDEFNMRRTRKQLPRPNQIEGSAAAKLVWPAKLVPFESDRSWHRLVCLDVPQLHVENFREHPAQIAFRAWAMSVVRRPGRTFKQAMEQLAYRQRVVPAEAFLSVIPNEEHRDFTDRFEADCRQGRIFPKPAIALSAVSFWPSCFSLIAPNTATCAKCPFQQDCRKMNDYSTEKSVSSSTLTADDLRRKKDRERQALHRTKKEAERGKKS